MVLSFQNLMDKSEFNEGKNKSHCINQWKYLATTYSEMERSGIELRGGVSGSVGGKLRGMTALGSDQLDVVFFNEST